MKIINKYKKTIGRLKQSYCSKISVNNETAQLFLKVEKEEKITTSTRGFIISLKLFYIYFYFRIINLIIDSINRIELQAH